jgi:hypothetical protein
MRRCLIVANRTLGGPQLIAEVIARQGSAPHSFHIVVPASHGHGTEMWTEGHAVAQARVALEHAVEHFGEAGVEVTGEVGDENPALAVGDVLRREHFDEIIVSTLPPGPSRWLKRDLPKRLAREHNLPVTHVVADAVLAD